MSMLAETKLPVETTSTNTRLALATIASVYGLKLRAYILSTVSMTEETLLRISALSFGTTP